MYPAQNKALHNSALRRAFKPPSFVDKPQYETSKTDQVTRSQPLTSPREQSSAQDIGPSTQPVKRRRLLVSPASIPSLTPGPAKKDPPATPAPRYEPRAPAPSPSPARLPISTTKVVTRKEHSKTEILAKPVKRKPTKTVPKPLPEVIIEQTPAPPGVSLSLPGQHAAMQPYLVPSEGAPLLDFSTVQRMQAALIPKQMPYISTQKRTQQHTTLDRITFNLTSSRCNLPGQWLAHGSMAGVTMPQLRTAETMDLTSPVASPEPLQQGTPMTDGIQDDAEQAYPQRSMSLGSEQYQQQQPQPPQQVILGSAMADDAEQVRPWSSMSFPSGHQQRQPEPTSQLEADEHTMPEAGSRTPQQKQLDWQHGKPVSMSSPGAVPASTPKDKEDLHTAMLAQLELQDREMEEVLRSPEKQLAEVINKPFFPMLGTSLDMAFFKSVCNV